jgi:hypothetical protein
MTAPFRPRGATVKLAATTTSAQATLSTQRDATAAGFDTVRVYNASGATAFIEFGTDPTAVSTGASMPVLAGSIETFGVSGGVTKAAAILASGTGDIYFTSGTFG